MEVENGCIWKVTIIRRTHCFTLMSMGVRVNVVFFWEWDSKSMRSRQCLCNPKTETLSLDQGMPYYGRMWFPHLDGVLVQLYLWNWQQQMLMSSRVRRGANSSNIQIRPCSFWLGPKSDMKNLGSPTTIFYNQGFVIIQGTTIFYLAWQLGCRAGPLKTYGWVAAGSTSCLAGLVAMVRWGENYYFFTLIGKSLIRIGPIQKLATCACVNLKNASVVFPALNCNLRCQQKPTERISYH